MFKTKKGLKKKGFTLIELMVVISILLILVGFMIPKFSAYQDKARSIKAKNTAKQIQTAAMASYGENNGKFDVESVETSIDELTTVKPSNTSLKENNDQVVNVTYDSDGKNYTVSIDASTNTYNLTKNGTTPASEDNNQDDNE